MEYPLGVELESALSSAKEEHAAALAAKDAEHEPALSAATEATAAAAPTREKETTSCQSMRYKVLGKLPSREFGDRNVSRVI